MGMGTEAGSKETRNEIRSLRSGDREWDKELGEQRRQDWDRGRFEGSVPTSAHSP